MMDTLHGWNRSLKPLSLGLVASIILILASYRIVSHTHLTSTLAVYKVFFLGILQAFIQLVFFMNLGLEKKPHWQLILFLFTFLVIVIIVGGSIWIMNNLNYNMMPDMGHP